MVNVSDLYQSTMEPERFYHVFNRANGNDKLFYEQKHYYYFMQKYKKYLDNYLDMYAFCLLPNHFHLLVKVKSKEQIMNAARHDLRDFQNLADQPGRLLSEKFKRFFISYAKSLNKERNRKGSLFMKPFKRIPIDSIKYLRNVIVYIHRNPIEHGIAWDLSNYRWTSYNQILNPKYDYAFNSEFIEWFDDRKNYDYCHHLEEEPNSSDGKEQKYFLA